MVLVELGTEPRIIAVNIDTDNYYMECRLIDHGLQLYYSGTVKPCCALTIDETYKDQYHISQINLSTWQHSKTIQFIRQQLQNNIWPAQCSKCQHIENLGRGDSVRLNANQAYNHYQPGDITLEIRPGNTCNFACQTCWPQASSRVASFYRRAGIKFDPENQIPWSPESIAPVLHRVKDIIILGGEPFYDKKCLSFLHWLLNQDHQPKITMFTNGSLIDHEFIQHYQQKITLVFSLDAIGKPAEYIRFGTQWCVVDENYQWCRDQPNIENRVNITTSPYNFAYIPDLIGYLKDQWPSVVSWGIASQSINVKFMDESVIPVARRSKIIKDLSDSIQELNRASIEYYQKINAINAIKSIVNNLEIRSFDSNAHSKMINFITAMDRVKGITLADFCPEVADYLGTKNDNFDRDSPTFLTSDTSSSID